MGSRLGFVVCALSLLAADFARASYTANVGGVTLFLTGNGSSDKLALYLAPLDSNTLLVDVKDDGVAEFFFDRTTITGIVIDAGGGNDTVEIDEANGAFADEAITIDGGAGNDSLSGGTGAEALNGGLGNDSIFGGGGADAIDAGDGDDAVAGGIGNDFILLGIGDDVATWGPGEGSDTLEGQGGDDLLAFNGSAAAEVYTLSAVAGRLEILRNVGAIDLDVDDVEHVELAAFGAADTVTANDLSTTDLVSLDIDLGVLEAADGAADSLTFHGSASAQVVSFGVTKGVVELEGLTTAVTIARAEALDSVTFVMLGGDDVRVLGTSKADVFALAPSPAAGALRTTADTLPLALDVAGGGQLRVFALGGNDTLAASGSIAALAIPVELDGGTGNDSLTGSNGADTLIGGTGNDVVDGDVGNDVVFLGSGNDTAVWGPGDGSDSIEAGTGTDRLDFICSNASEVVTVSPNGERVMLTRNVGAIVMDLNDFELISVPLFGGTDAMLVDDLTGTDLKQVTVDLEGVAGSGTGDAVVDTIAVNGTALADKMNVSASAKGVLVSRPRGSVLIEHAEIDDSLQLNGLAGVDKISVAATASNSMTITIDPE